MPDGIKAETGVCLEIPGEDGSSSTATVTHVWESSVTLDFNHPLAGKELIFDISLLEIV